MSTQIELRVGVLPDLSTLLVRTYANGEVTAELYRDGIATGEVALASEPMVVTR